MTLYKYFDDTPQTPKQSYWIAENATLIGKVIIGEEVGIWFGAVIRGDNEPVVIGKRTNIQENRRPLSPPMLNLSTPDYTIIVTPQ